MRGTNLLIGSGLALRFGSEGNRNTTFIIYLLSGLEFIIDLDIILKLNQPSFIICTNCSKKTFPFSRFLPGPGSASEPFSIIFSIYSVVKSMFS